MKTFIYRIQFDVKSRWFVSVLLGAYKMDLLEKGDECNRSLRRRFWDRIGIALKGGQEAYPVLRDDPANDNDFDTIIFRGHS